MTGPSCDNLLRLSFEAHAEYQLYTRTNAKMFQQIWWWHENLGNRAVPITMAGICDICVKQTTFSTTPQKAPDGDHFAFRASWWNGMLCECGITTICRSVFRALLDGGSLHDRIYHVGQYSEFLRWLTARMPNLTATQYEAGRRPGELEYGVRYEDLTGLSFADGEFDCIICMEILEHIPDYKAALREMARVLRPGGRALMTFPWLGGDYVDHLIRAEVRPDGSINHILPPEYHGDPARGEGILSFRAVGWKILDEIRNAGFSAASANFVFGPLHGYATLLNPVVVGVR
jgi:SAM-dependent methyltransferase